MSDPALLTPEQIAALEALEKAATEAPWIVYRQEYTCDLAPQYKAVAREIRSGAINPQSKDHDPIISPVNRRAVEDWAKHGVWISAADAAFIAALRNAAPALIASAKALAEAQAKADECEVDWEVWNTENTRLQSALAAAQARIAELVAAICHAETEISDVSKWLESSDIGKAWYMEGPEFYEDAGRHAAGLSILLDRLRAARLAELEKENGNG